MEHINHSQTLEKLSQLMDASASGCQAPYVNTLYKILTLDSAVSEAVSSIDRRLQLFDPTDGKLPNEDYWAKTLEDKDNLKLQITFDGTTSELWLMSEPYLLDAFQHFLLACASCAMDNIEQLGPISDDC